MKRSTLCLSLAVALVSFPLWGAEYKVEAVQAAAPEGVAEPIAKQLGKTAFRISDEDGPVCEVWLANPLKVVGNFKPTNERVYPLEAGQVVGAISFPGRSRDFRDQRLGKGVYTLRYALQPQDGNHIGTSDTRDFLVMIKAADDEGAEKIDNPDKLIELAAAAANSTHPAMLALKRRTDKPEKFPALRHDEEHELWILQLAIDTKAGDKAGKLEVDLVVIGHAAE